MKKYSETKGGKNLIKAIEWHENKKGRKWFDFTAVVREWNSKKECGSVCCFVGNLGHIFKKETTWVFLGGIHYIGASEKGYTDYDEVASYFFDLDLNVSNYLFRPARQNCVAESLVDLPEDTSPKALCKELRKFIKLVDDGTLNMDGTQK